MKRETLKSLGLNDEQIDSIMAENGRDIEKFKSDLATAQTEVTTLKTQLTEAGATIESFKALKPDELKAAADDWKAKAEAAQKAANEQVAQVKFDYALTEALKGAKVKDPADVIPHLKRDMLKLGDDGKFVGLNEQIEPLKTAKAYLFEVDQNLPQIVTGGNNQSVNVDALTAAMRSGAGLKTT